MFLSACSIERKKVSNVNACNILESCNNESNETDKYIGNGIIKEISLEEFYNIIACKSTSVLFVGRDSCKWCNQVKDIINNRISDSLITYYINIDIIPEDNREEFTDKICDLVKLDRDELGVPLLVKVNDGVCLEMLNGIPDYSNVSKEIEDTWLKSIIAKFLS